MAMRTHKPQPTMVVYDPIMDRTLMRIDVGGWVFTFTSYARTRAGVARAQKKFEAHVRRYRVVSKKK